eukprot:TRINITY_DN926_c0_g1_i1.p1 TRINITY_DN926_c0_g1~~TRINITY_DN926_c0_g1_i1.p1  ORF type:complete len:175 (-),score=55.33 TRINITY_DN926_c0_g1_i1:257-781(-)
MSVSQVVSANSLCKEIQMLEIRIKNRVENNAEMHRYGHDKRLDNMQGDLSKMMAQMSAMMPKLSPTERQQVLANVSEMDSAKLLNEQAVRAIGLSKKIRKLEARAKFTALCKSASSSEENVLSGLSSEDEVDEQQDIQAKINALTIELSGLLPMLDDTTKQIVLENVQAAYEQQ